MGFSEVVRHSLTAIVSAVPINVLVWGASKEDPANYAKRNKIRERLQTELPNADVRFSEDAALAQAVPGSRFLQSHEQELWHLAACDLCVVLDTSKGAGEEIAHFVGSLYSHRLFILTHERYADVSSFPASLRSYQNQVFYTDDEYESCNLVERVLARARLAALRKLGNFQS